MFPNEKARLMRMMDSHGVPAVNASGAKMDFTQRVTWLIEHANQQSAQADEFVCTACGKSLAAYWSFCPQCDQPQVIRR